ncbi:NAD(P)-binding protein [Didymella exigua CBS 183.55]|uniref:NAD(P)-binding protein n=1 Tax=Didymella exigua CBS 183.55 TaxID=1150837 RepID=A0A6A5RS71_9PLEO|nr:NAD(P)-binding protein [Didymella exigua CBS 183.55]KAF1928337.1 NAD(P)-binding protein [Didymella exigua CBS 183.55]
MAALAKEIVLVTGANSGIGFELARQLLAKGTYHVLLSVRSTQRGTDALKDLESRNLPGSIEFLPLDLQDDATIAQAATYVTTTHGHLDILVNNAATASFASADRAAFKDSFDTNATGPYLLSKALIDLLQKSQNPRIINVSSGAGSIGRRLTPASPMYKIQAEPYRTSKVAMNMLTMCLHVEYGLNYGDDGKGVKVFAHDPGFTVSNLSAANTKEQGARAAEESVKSLMDVVEGKRDDRVGRFIHNSGEYPW